MSVLTVSGSAALPDRTLQYHKTAPFPSRLQDNSSSSPERQVSLEQPRTIPAFPQAPPVGYHSHSRTISSAVLPADIPSGTPAQGQPWSSPTSFHHNHSRQSSASTFGAMQRQATTTSYTGAPRRSTSSRSNATTSSTSYVTLMRKQKATVWCDRSQSIDPRLAAAQRVAKQRAAMEVNGVISYSGRTSTISSGGVVGKIRHGGVPRAPGYTPANMSGAGVPMRLSANEMLGDEEEDGRSLATGDGMTHGRTGSGKSSASSRFRSGYPRPEGRFSGSNTPPGDLISSSKDNIPELSENNRRPPPRSDSEDSFGDVKELSGPNALQKSMHDAKKNDDLRRRGSVDERAMSMGAGVRLFIANPDLDD